MEAVRKVHTHLNLGGNEIRDARVEHLSEDPAPSSGRIVFNPETGEFRFSDGKKWFPLNCPWDVDPDGNIVVEGNVIIRGNLIVEKDIASGDYGQNTPGTGGLDMEQLKTYLDSIGNIDKYNIAQQKVDAATKIVANGVEHLWVAEDKVYAKGFYVPSTAVASGAGFGFYGDAKDYGLTAEKTGEAALVQLGGFHGVRINTYTGYALYPAVNDRTGLGTSSLRWSTIYGIDGDFSGNVRIKGSSLAGMTEGAGALNIGSGAVLMLDANDIQAKANGTTVAPLYINSWGGDVRLGHIDYTTVSVGSFTAPQVKTPMLKSVSGGLDIVAFDAAEGARLWLTIGTFRPWGADNGKIDLGSSAAQWRTVYAINIVASGDVATM